MNIEIKLDGYFWLLLLGLIVVIVVVKYRKGLKEVLSFEKIK